MSGLAYLNSIIQSTGAGTGYRALSPQQEAYYKERILVVLSDRSFLTNLYRAMKSYYPDPKKYNKFADGIYLLLRTPPSMWGYGQLAFLAETFAYSCPIDSWEIAYECVNGAHERLMG